MKKETKKENKVYAKKQQQQQMRRTNSIKNAPFGLPSGKPENRKNREPKHTISAERAEGSGKHTLSD